MFGNKQWFNQGGGFPTPEDIPAETASRTFCIPGSTAWLALVMGCLMQLADEENWQQWDGGLSAEDAAQAAQDIIDSGYDGTCAVDANLPTPYWDDATDVDDQLPPAEQTWYGYVDDPDADPAELTFVEDATIWAFTGLVAYAGGVGAAIAFRTIAPTFVLQARGKPTPEVIRIFVDGYLSGEYDTTGHEDEIIEMPCVGDPALSEHQIYVVKAS